MNPEYVANVHQLKIYLGISQATCSSLTALDGFPLKKQQGYNFKDVTDFILNNPEVSNSIKNKIAKKMGIETEGTDLELSIENDSPALERYRIAHAKIEEMNLEIKRGNYIEKDKFEDDELKRFSMFKQAIDQLVLVLPNRVHEKSLEEIQIEIKYQMNELLKKLQKDLTTKPPEAPSIETIV